jgi:hypothetical protein
MMLSACNIVNNLIFINVGHLTGSVSGARAYDQSDSAVSGVGLQARWQPDES